MKPHEETWRASGPCLIPDASEGFVDAVAIFNGPTCTCPSYPDGAREAWLEVAKARAKLAACAPAMGRMLLDLVATEADVECIFVRADAEALLRLAGVID